MINGQPQIRRIECRNPAYGFQRLEEEYTCGSHARIRPRQNPRAQNRDLSLARVRAFCAEMLWTLVTSSPQRGLPAGSSTFLRMSAAISPCIRRPGRGASHDTSRIMNRELRPRCAHGPRPRSPPRRRHTGRGGTLRSASKKTAPGGISICPMAEAFATSRRSPSASSPVDAQRRRQFPGPR